MKIIKAGIIAGCLLLSVPAVAAVAPARAVTRRAAADTRPQTAAAVIPDFIADTPVADPGDTGMLWTLAECERYALAQHPALAAATAGHAAALAQAAATRAANYPDITLQGAYRRWESHAFLPASVARLMGSGTLGPFDDYSSAIKGGWTLYDFGQREGAQDVADLQARAAAAGVTLTEAQLLTAVQVGYYNLLAAQAARVVAWQRLGRANAHLVLTEQKKAAGAVARADVVRVKVEVANARLAYINMASAVTVARANLNAALGRRAEEALRLAPATGAVAIPSGADRAAALLRVQTARPEMQVANERVAARRAAVAAARAAYRPKLRADASAGWRDDDWLPADEDWSVGVSFQVPLFNGFLFDRNLDKAEAELKEEEAVREQLAVALQQEVCVAYAQFAAAGEAVLAAGALVEDARESLRVARERYAAGAGTVNDLLDAQTNVSGAELAEAQAVFQLRITAAVWQRVSMAVINAV